MFGLFLPDILLILFYDIVIGSRTAFLLYQTRKHYSMILCSLPITYYMIMNLIYCFNFFFCLLFSLLRKNMSRPTNIIISSHSKLWQYIVHNIFLHWFYSILACDENLDFIFELLAYTLTYTCIQKIRPSTLMLWIYLHADACISSYLQIFTHFGWVRTLYEFYVQ